MAEMDEKMLAEVFAGIDPDTFDVELAGYSGDQYDEILSALGEAIQSGELHGMDDEVQPPDDPVTKLGDLWKLGAHRLICGDSTDPGTLGALMDGSLCNLWLTDPPYNVALGMGGSFDEARKRHRRTDGLVIMNDSMEDGDFYRFLLSAFQAARDVMQPGAAFYIWHADNEGLNFRTALKDSGLQLRQTLVWNKDHFTLGRQDYQWKHEPCLYGWKEGAPHFWNSDRKQTTVLDFDRPVRSEEHPTMKPVALFQYQIENSTEDGQLVLDSFGGSGTTLIACEAAGRKAFLAELDPRYCDVIVKRYMNVTGRRDAVLVRDGKEIPANDTGILNE